jgi:hypothetical protein
MTRQHFKALAEALKFERPGANWDPNKRVQWEQDCKAIADVCNRFNGGFKRDRFLSACGL